MEMDLHIEGHARGYRLVRQECLSMSRSESTSRHLCQHWPRQKSSNQKLGSFEAIDPTCGGLLNRSPPRTRPICRRTKPRQKSQSALARQRQSFLFATCCKRYTSIPIPLRPRQTRKERCGKSSSAYIFLKRVANAIDLNGDAGLQSDHACCNPSYGLAASRHKLGSIRLPDGSADG